MFRRVIPMLCSQYYLYKWPLGTIDRHQKAIVRSGKDERVKGTAAQALLDRGWGKPRVEVVTNEQPDTYITALQAVSARLDASEQPQITSTVHVRPEQLLGGGYTQYTKRAC